MVPHCFKVQLPRFAEQVVLQQIGDRQIQPSIIKRLEDLKSAALVVYF